LTRFPVSRYGWIPDSYDIPNIPKFASISEVEPGSRSTTEMEIKYGFLDRPSTALPFFYLRDAKFMGLPKFKSQDDQHKQVIRGREREIRIERWDERCKDIFSHSIRSMQRCFFSFDSIDAKIPFIDTKTRFFSFHFISLIDVYA
jgi:hypothetical protein